MIDAQATKIVQAEVSEAVEIWNMIQPFKIQTADDITTASEMIVEAKTRWKKLDAQEHTITKPLNESLKATRDLFRAPKEYFARIETFFKAAIATHAQAEAERNRLATAAAAKAFAAGDNAQTSLALEQVTDLKTTAAVSGVGTREAWDFEVENLNELPLAYLLANETKIRAALAKDIRLPGVRYFKKIVVSARIK